MNYPYSKMCKADGKHVSTKRHSCLTYKISIKNHLLIIIIIRDIGSTILILTLYIYQCFYSYVGGRHFSRAPTVKKILFFGVSGAEGPHDRKFLGFFGFR